MLAADDRAKENNTPSVTSNGQKGRGESEESDRVLSVEEALELAFSRFDDGRILDAERLCRLVLEQVGDQVDAIQLLGSVLNERGAYGEAIELLSRAISQAPGYAHLHNNLAMALYKAGKIQESVSHFGKAVEIRPDFAKAYNNMAVALMKLGRFDEAVAACREAVRLQVDFKQAYNNLGLALKKKGQLENSVLSFEKALELDGDYAEALGNLGIVQIDQGRLEKAMSNLFKAVRIDPASAEFWNNLGVVFNRQGLLEEAVTACETAIDLRADYVEAHNNLGTVFMELGRYAEAKASFERSIAIEPEMAQAHHNLSLVLLVTGEFEQGWDEYEWRWKHSGFSTPLRGFSQPWWTGSVSDVGKLLVWAEQGIGDEVHFSVLIGHILSRGIEVVVECDRRLVGLLKRSYPGMVVVERTDPASSLLSDSSITHQIPMVSIPRVLGLSPDTMAFEKAYLVPDAVLRDQFRVEYKGDSGALLVGISFRSQNTQEGSKRSIDLPQWGPIFHVQGVRFVNLQYGDCLAQLREVYDRFGVEILQDKRVDPLKDLESFAAQMASMDLVISVDNSTVHFAGALGVEVWTMLPSAPDWRWGLEGDRTRWYQTMRLFRQEQDDWSAVIARVASELSAMAEKKRAMNYL